MAEIFGYILIAAIAVVAIILALALLGFILWLLIVVLGVVLYFASLPILFVIWVLAALGILSAATADALREGISNLWKKTRRLFTRAKPQPDEQPNPGAG